MLKIYSLSKLQAHNTVLLMTVTMLRLRSPELIRLVTEAFHLWPASRISPHLRSTLCFSEFDEKASVSLTVATSRRATLQPQKPLKGPSVEFRIYTNASLDFSVILWIKPAFHSPQWCTSYCCHQQNGDPTVLVPSKRKNSVERHRAVLSSKSFTKQSESMLTRKDESGLSGNQKQPCNGGRVGLFIY